MSRFTFTIFHHQMCKWGNLHYLSMIQKNTALSKLQNLVALDKDPLYIFSEKSTTLAADTDLPDVAVLSDLSDLWPHLNSEHDWDVKTPDTGLAELGRGPRGQLTFF